MLGDIWLTQPRSIADFDLAFILHRLLSHPVKLPAEIRAYVERGFSVCVGTGVDGQKCKAKIQA